MEGEMIQATEVSKEVVPEKPKQEKGPVSYLINAIRETIAILFWVYVLVKLFAFDIDVFLMNKLLPEFVWLLNLKFFILIGIIASIWLVTKNKHILSWSLHVFFYPAIVLLWKIPFFIFKQKSWILAFAFINSIISFFKSIKYSFITSAFFLASVAIIFSFSNEKLLWFATAIILGVLLITYIHRFILVFKPSSIFQVHIKIFSGIRKHGVSSFALDESIKNLPVASLDQKQMEKWTTNLQMSVLFNRVCLFAARKLRDYQNSGLNIVSYVLTILMLIVLTIFSFAVINYGLFKIDANLFGYSVAPTFFTFFYYSFNNLLFNSIREIAPTMPISQTASMIESFFALFLVVIFVSLLLSVRSQRHAEELNEVIKGIEGQGKDMEGFIKDEYKINSIDDAMAELEKLKAGMAKFIYKITESIQ
ncbi:MAG: hypothetical protein A2X87_00255 [Deltaproteobacteria bacterium GWC2_42_51]|nr:MAG: hypothetical protein A2056_04490 [Deltaproteobacteria bacterium GWA2_42_85]OGP36897.1 MAG: hypothetical protein A2X87_00255 [Deltaproteobacteria bacterium GWC2_42_51]OGQ25634.1 MAG: hypothetical protein A3D29_06935 [Deltaproteobacteria bacterium RIFCSPHIGHO2_02_FULL_42_44]OGQ37410.1 MAG: hypothetical protein A3H47_05275 [Deltaproteobacteria bacterium RIFCSPLOWO2_02_FULL_42_39]OGQ75519.1 MAG: hypothetical protein A2235_11995 [Deltaproteobacteria bacterium RIFOXYA2_FULL_42_10]HAG49715.1 